MLDTPVLDVSSLLAAAAVFVAILAAVYARRSADAAKSSASIAKTALVSTQRAFVFAPKIDALNIIDPQTLLVREIHIVPTWENAGLTPARRLAAYIDQHFFAPGEAINIVLEAPPADVVRFDVGPKTTFQGNIVRISAPDVLRVLQQQARLFIWGACEYSDVFDGTPRHNTKYCYEVEVAIDPRVPINPANAETKFLRFKAATEHNAAD